MADSNVLGIDLGGTKIAAARYKNTTWALEDESKRATHAEFALPHVIEHMVELVEELRTEDTTAIGIGVPGLVHQPDGVVLVMPNIPESANAAVKAELEEATSLPVCIDNDANCFTLAESIVGQGKGHNTVVGITLGTGVGGGIVIDEKIFHGSNGFAGEIGHMLLMPGKPPFETDDKRGEVEQFFSGSAMGKRCQAATSPGDYLGGEVCEFMHKDIFKEIAWMCTSLIHLLDPGVIVFGGSAGHALAPHLDGVKQELGNWLLPGTPLPELAISDLKHTATLGAALLCR